MGKAIGELITLVSSATFYRGVREETDGKEATKNPRAASAASTAPRLRLDYLTSESASHYNTRRAHIERDHLAPVREEPDEVETLTLTMDQIELKSHACELETLSGKPREVARRNSEMPDPLLTIRNHHGAACGDPPIVNEDSGNTYIGYFENQHGEQWIYTCNRATGEAELRGGDVGWNKAWPVTDGKVDGLNLNREETLWLQACLAAVKAR